MLIGNIFSPIILISSISNSGRGNRDNDYLVGLLQIRMLAKKLDSNC